MGTKCSKFYYKICEKKRNVKLWRIQRFFFFLNERVNYIKALEMYFLAALACFKILEKQNGGETKRTNTDQTLEFLTHMVSAENIFLAFSTIKRLSMNINI